MYSYYFFNYWHPSSMISQFVIEHNFFSFLKNFPTGSVATLFENFKFWFLLNSAIGKTDKDSLQSRGIIFCFILMLSNLISSFSFLHFMHTETSNPGSTLKMVMLNGFWFFILTRPCSKFMSHPTVLSSHLVIGQTFYNLLSKILFMNRSVLFNGLKSKLINLDSIFFPS